MKIRRATVLDAKSLAQVEQTQPLSAHWGEKGFCTEIPQAASQIWCAEEGENLIGFAALRFTAGFGELLNVAVRPEFCRQGIGFKLISRLINQVLEGGGEQITLEVNIRNRAAIALYSKAGFCEVGRREKFYNGTDDALIMSRNL